MEYNVIEHIAEGVILGKLDTRELLSINQSMKDILRLSEEESFQAVHDLFVSERSMEEIWKEIEQDLLKQEYSEQNLKFLLKDGKIIEVNFDCIWIEKENQIVGCVAKNSSEHQKANYLNFKEIAEFLPSGVVVMEIAPQLSIIYANEEQYKMLDMNVKEENCFFEDLIYEEDREWVMDNIYGTLKFDEDVDIEFRVKNQEVGFKWVRLFGRVKQSQTGKRLFYSSLKDLSMYRGTQNNKMHIERVLLHKIAELTEEVLFRIDLETNVIYFMGNTSNIFGGETSMGNFPECILDLNILYEEDMPIFSELMKAFEMGLMKEFEMRYRMLDGSVEWHKIIYNFIKDKDGNVLVITGKLINIQEHKLLEEQARIDLLTGLFNKITTETEINKLMIDDEHLEEHALFIIDLDNFKEVNDNLGHHFGDIVLHGIGMDIKNCFRSEDILGRIGGDEFIVLMKNCDDKTVIIERAERICKRLEKTFQGEFNQYSISASVGIAMYPRHGTTFKELYQAADKALYESKGKGKNTYTEFQLTDIDTGESEDIPTFVLDRRRKKELIDYEILSTVFNMLYETKHIPNSLNEVIAYLGSMYEVDRCYIFETKSKTDIYENHYQWFREGVVEESKTHYLTAEILKEIYEKSDEDGIFQTDNIYSIEKRETVAALEDDQVVSLLVIRLLKESDYHMFLGMDDCRRRRVWKEQDLKILFHLSKTIFSVLIHHNTIKQLKEKIEQLEYKNV